MKIFLNTVGSVVKTLELVLDMHTDIPSKLFIWVHRYKERQIGFKT